MADRLGLIVSEMRDRMSNDEFIVWSRFHARKAQAREIASKASR